MSCLMLTLHSIELDDVQLDIFWQMCYAARSLANVFSKKKIFVLFVLRPFDFETCVWIKQDAHWNLTEIGPIVIFVNVDVWEFSFVFLLVSVWEQRLCWSLQVMRLLKIADQSVALFCMVGHF